MVTPFGQSGTNDGADQLFSDELGFKNYELTNHLGNVMAVVNDRKLNNSPIPIPGQISLLSSIQPEVLSYQDYYPFGSVMPGRQFNTQDYRYGFQKQEKDNEIYGTENILSFKFRLEDTRLGRFWSVDPLASKYPYYSQYAFSGNRVIDAFELEGKEPNIMNKTASSNAPGNGQGFEITIHTLNGDNGKPANAGLIGAMGANANSAGVISRTTNNTLIPPPPGNNVGTSGSNLVQAYATIPFEYQEIKNKAPKLTYRTDQFGFCETNQNMNVILNSSVSGLKDVDVQEGYIFSGQMFSPTGSQPNPSQATGFILNNIFQQINANPNRQLFEIILTFQEQQGGTFSATVVNQLQILSQISRSNIMILPGNPGGGGAQFNYNVGVPNSGLNYKLLFTYPAPIRPSTTDNN